MCLTFSEHCEHSLNIHSTLNEILTFSQHSLNISGSLGYDFKVILDPFYQQYASGKILIICLFNTLIYLQSVKFDLFKCRSQSQNDLLIIVPPNDPLPGRSNYPFQLQLQLCSML